MTRTPGFALIGPAQRLFEHVDSTLGAPAAAATTRITRSSDTGNRADLVRHESRLDAHNLAERLLDGSPDAILICDPAGTVRYWNAAAERIFGFPVAEALGVSMNLIIPERLRARHWAAWETTMSTGITRYGGGQLLAVPALHKDGRQISIEFSIQLVKDAGGVMEWVVAVIRDVTERYRHEKRQRARLTVLEAKMVEPH